MPDRHLDTPYWALRLAFGIVPIVAGLDKFFNLLTNWEQYLSPLAVHLLPVSPGVFMRAAGVIEIVVGIAVLAGLTRLGAYAASVWLALIGVELLTTGHYFDVAARDVVMAVGAFSLARLDEVRLAARARVAERVPRGIAPARSGA